MVATPGRAGQVGVHGNQGLNGMAAGPASNGGSKDSAVYSSYVSDITSPTATLSAPSVTCRNAASLTPCTFTVAYSDPVMVNGSSISGALVQMQPPSGSAITATAIQITLSGLQDGNGDAQTITVAYQITAPGGSWTSAPKGTYQINLVSNPPTDFADFYGLGEAITFADVQLIHALIGSTLPPLAPPG